MDIVGQPIKIQEEETQYRSAISEGLMTRLGAAVNWAIDASGRIFNIQFFTASGTYTPSANAKSALVICVGGGGGGSTFDLGLGGFVAGGTGGTSSFGSLISCTGGGGGSYTGDIVGINFPGVPGVATGADVNNLAFAGVGMFGAGFLGYGNGGTACGTETGAPLLPAFSGGAGGSGIKLIETVTTQVVTVGTGGASQTSALRRVQNGRQGCVIVIEIR